MMILGLDTGTKTGWCLYYAKEKKILESGVQDFSKKRGETNGLMFLRFRKWLRELAKGTWPDVKLIGYERAHFRGGYATEIGVGLQTRVQEVAAELGGIETAAVHTGTLKKWATGHGKASKEDMMRVAEKYLGRPPISDDEADAVLIALWTAEEYAG